MNLWRFQTVRLAAIGIVTGFFSGAVLAALSVAPASPEPARYVAASSAHQAPPFESQWTGVHIESSANEVDDPGPAPSATSACAEQNPSVTLDLPTLARDGVLSHPDVKGWGLGATASVETDAVGAPSAISGHDANGAAHLAIRLPKGSINPGHSTAPKGGIGLRWHPTALAATRRACLTYRLYLPADFNFARGGKLPGLIGGDAPTGGKRADPNKGFSLRLMWRAKGAGEVYAYIPGQPDGRGLSIGRGAWTFPRGRWVEVAEEVQLNRPGHDDGWVRVIIDGREVLRRDRLRMSDAASLTIDGAAIDVFYGGKSQTWAAPADTTVRIADVRISIPSAGTPMPDATEIQPRREHGALYGVHFPPRAAR